MYEDDDQIDGSPAHSRNTRCLARAATSVLGGSDGAGESLGGMAQAERLREWAEAGGHIVPASDWDDFRIVSKATAEHEVRYRPIDDCAVKRTWPGTFGFVPRLVDGAWKPVPATPLEYLNRQQLQNRVFDDNVILEGVMLSEAPSMIIGAPSGGISLVISQPWLRGREKAKPHPSEEEISSLMKDLGFSRFINALYGWRNPSTGVVVLDAKPDNFILTERGILPIDLLLTTTLPDEP